MKLLVNNKKQINKLKIIEKRIIKNYQNNKIKYVIAKRIVNITVIVDVTQAVEDVH